MDFFDLKANVEFLFEHLKIAGIAIENHEEKHRLFQPGLCGVIRKNGQVYGHLGKVHPFVSDKFDLGGRDLTGFASRGQQRTAILAFKLAELDLLTELDGRPPLLLLDDVFSELDPERRSHLVRRIAELPQAFVTTTTLDDLDPGLRAIAQPWEVRAEADGARLTASVASVVTGVG